MERNTARERKLTFHDGEYYEGSFKDGEVYGTSDSPWGQPLGEPKLDLTGAT